MEMWFLELPSVDIRASPGLFQVVRAFERAAPAVQVEALTSYGRMGNWMWIGVGYADARLEKWRLGWLAEHPEFRDSW